MNELSKHDIELLFKSIVLVEEGGNVTETETVAQTVPPQPASVDVEEQKDAPDARTLPEATLRVTESEDESAKEILPETIIPSVVLICRSTDREALLRSGSNMDKILQSLHLSHLKTHCMSYEEVTDLKQLAQCKSIWGVGLDNSQEQSLSELGKARLFSANPEKLSSKTEKLAMFGPLKTFASQLR